MDKNQHKTSYKLFKHYYETRTQFINAPDQEKIEWSNFYVQKLYEPYLKTLDKDAAILDLGCEKGFILNAFSKLGFSDLTGVDRAKTSIYHAQKLFSAIAFFEDDIFSYLEQHKNRYDLIILKAVIEHVPKDSIEKLLQLMYQALKPGGFVLIDVYNAAYLFVGHERYMDFTHEIGFTHESLAQIMRLIFDQVSVSAYRSPIMLSWHAKIRRTMVSYMVKKLLVWAEPEMNKMPFLERIIIGHGIKKE